MSEILSDELWQQYYASMVRHDMKASADILLASHRAQAERIAALGRQVEAAERNRILEAQRVQERFNVYVKEYRHVLDAWGVDRGAILEAASNANAALQLMLEAQRAADQQQQAAVQRVAASFARAERME